MLAMEDRVKNLFGLSIETKIMMADTLSDVIAKAGSRLIDCLLNDHKIILCGNGGSAANCLHFSAAMLNRFEVERPSLPVIALTTDISMITAAINDHHYDQIFSRQILAIAQEGDILIILSSAGNSMPVLNALNAANERGIDTIALTGRDGGVLGTHLGPEDIEIRVPGDTGARIRENHLFVLHCFCDLIDHALFSQIPG